MEASERRREAESISRLSTALAQAGSGREAANRLFDELESVLEVTRMMIATVDEEAGVAAGYAARGIDEAWWQTVVLDLETARSAVVAVGSSRRATSSSSSPRATSCASLRGAGSLAVPGGSACPSATPRSRAS